MRHGQLATTSRRGKVPIFKPKAPSFHTTEFSYLNYFPQKIDQIFGFWAGQGLKLRRNTCFRRFKSSLAVSFHVPKPVRLALKNVNFILSSFKLCPYGNNFWPTNLGDLNIILVLKINSSISGIFLKMRDFSSLHFLVKHLVYSLSGVNNLVQFSLW